MKKLVIGLLLLALVCVVPASADPFATGAVAGGKVWVLQLDNPAGNATPTVVTLANPDGYMSSDTSTMGISAGSRILGLNIVPYDATLSDKEADNVNESGTSKVHWEAIVGLYDNVTDDGNTYAEMIAEIEAGVDGQDGREWFIYPIIVETKLLVNQGPNTTVLLYYVR
jgi:hypothetical protein